jgi:ribosomal protein S18 acetylase RimI-like enzyme
MERADDTLPRDVTIECATPADADTSLGILQEAARWLLSRGIDQWRPDQFERGSVLAAIARGELYLARRDGAVVATLRLQWTDERVWGSDTGDAGYVHGLAIRRRAAGVGLGRAMLRWAERAVVAAGRTYLRLDCMTANLALRSYYERAGFTYRGDVHGKTWSASRYEKRVEPA